MRSFRLERLDDRVVPAVAAALRRRLDQFDRLGLPARVRLLHRPGRLDRIGAAEQPGAPLTNETRRARPTRLRAAPQWGLLLLAGLVFLTGSVVALTYQEPRPNGTADAGPLPVGAATLTGIGPTVGQLAETYVSDTRRQTQRSTAQAPDSVQLALVALTGYLTPAQVVALVGALPVERVLLQAQVTVGTAAVVDSPVSRVVPDLTALFARIVDHKQVDARDLKRTGESIKPTNQEQTDFQAFYRTALATAEQEIVIYQQGCPCVFMLLVRGRASDLEALEASPQVRVVAFAPAGLTTGQLVVTPLLPGTTGPVKILARTNAAGG